MKGKKYFLGRDLYFVYFLFSYDQISESLECAGTSFFMDIKV